ncbi:hypothetical protein EJ05DRAFT_473065 [Pseudovirgaria hyperparasitica]|uniref:DUF7730 domain-containing protein n=1 Tax=Pseudovirgaria hyperparasitica TaxID=470096 RepID=A0A6A6WJ32_9PEZI|nr:uncharacterized protein EJ05DRAFT_473065 [Pseudovirgaria hyperparasitica]KAF2762130.1 hypothetical protein EJ05DRAFT_473065 [Pseudovirgaria hyperparasitica]
MGLSDLQLTLRGVRRGSKASISSIAAIDESSIVHPMLRSRKRTLSIPLLHPAKVGLTKRSLQSTLDQEQCLLFKMLPYEIRLIIWELILGGKHVHIFNWKKLGHQVCQTLEESSYGVRQVCLFRMPVDGTTKAVIHGAPQKLLPLLRSCRRIYSEAIDILYAKNIFDFNNLRYKIDGLSDRLMPCRWNSIRQVSLTWYFPSSKLDAGRPLVENDWDRSCRALASMTGLQKLTVGLITERSTIERTYIREILGPVESISTTGLYVDIYVSWEETEDSSRAERTLLGRDVHIVLHHLPTIVSKAYSESIHAPRDIGSLYRPRQTSTIN